MQHGVTGQADDIGDVVVLTPVVQGLGRKPTVASEDQPYPRKPRENGPRYRKVKKTGRRLRPRSEWIPIAIPAIISRSLFEKVQEQLRRNAEPSPRNTKREYLLRGLIYCPCGQRRSAEGTDFHLYYRCNDRINRFPLPRQCQSGGVCAPVADHAVWNTLCEFLANPHRLRVQAERWLAERQPTDTTHGEDRNRWETERQKLHIEEERYARAYGEGVLSFETYRSLIESLAVRRQSLEAEACASVAPGPVPNPALSLEELVEGTLYTLKQLDFSHRRTVVVRLVEKVVADPETLLIRGQIPLILTAHAGLRSDDPYLQNIKSTARCQGCSD